MRKIKTLELVSCMILALLLTVAAFLADGWFVRSVCGGVAVVFYYVALFATEVIDDDNNDL